MSGLTSEERRLTEAERGSICICPLDLMPPHESSRHTYDCSQHLAAVERILAARTSTATADTGLRARVEALHAPMTGGDAGFCAECSRANTRDQRWPCATIRALDATAAPTADTGARE